MGGSQYQAKMLIDYLLPQNRFEIFYLARRVPAHSTNRGYSIVQIAGQTAFRKYGYFLDSIRLYRLLKKIKPDVIYQMVGSAYTGVAAYYAKKTRCKMFWRITSDKSVEIQGSLTWREFLPHRLLERRLMGYGIRRVQYIVAQTDTQARLLEKNYQRSPTAVIRNTHPIPLIESSQKSLPLKVVWIANFKKLKQPEIFVQLAADLQDRSNAQFVMVGAPAPKEGWYKEIVGRISALVNIEYKGILKQDEVNALLAESHVLVNTSEYEGFSNTFIQAWLHEVPVVSLNSNPDNLLDNDYLGGFANGDYHKLLQLVSSLLDNPMRIKGYGERSRSFAEKTFSKKNIEQLAALFAQ